MRNATLLGAAAIVLGLGSAYAPATMAAPLTAHECQSYPFVKSNGAVTHRQLMRELRELEAVGYDPARIDVYYPSDIEKAERRLHAKYERDCTGGAAGAQTPGTAQGL
ncbi:DUF4148 domain-containing protein [Paraburkholderia acidipaludis]|uniref:DUF4148 domain-containing protein n=1 Tax=Paraburkholderia acidipaludis TaxID=660537 RepID=UPI0005BE388D|nr:DUF4148 domain-containing protein [Paraburkholderia acidipaludis]